MVSVLESVSEGKGLDEDWSRLLGLARFGQLARNGHQGWGFMPFESVGDSKGLGDLACFGQLTRNGYQDQGFVICLLESVGDGKGMGDTLVPPARLGPLFVSSPAMATRDRGFLIFVLDSVGEIKGLSDSPGSGQCIQNAPHGPGFILFLPEGVGVDQVKCLREEGVSLLGLPCFDKCPLNSLQGSASTIFTPNGFSDDNGLGALACFDKSGHNLCQVSPFNKVPVDTVGQVKCL